MKRYWSDDGEDVYFHDTADEAIAKCEEALEWHRDNASEGWPEEIENICWGKVLGHVVESERREHLPTCNSEDCDEDCPVQSTYVDYELVELKEE